MNNIQEDNLSTFGALVFGRSCVCVYERESFFLHGQFVRRYGNAVPLKKLCKIMIACNKHMFQISKFVRLFNGFGPVWFAWSVGRSVGRLVDSFQVGIFNIHAYGFVTIFIVFIFNLDLNSCTMRTVIDSTLFNLSIILVLSTFFFPI